MIRRHFLLIGISMWSFALLAHSASDSNADLDPTTPMRERFCGRPEIPAVRTELPEIGCFSIPTGGKASGQVDGHKFEITVRSDSGPQCRLDGVLIGCDGCVGQRVRGCPMGMHALPFNIDRSLTLSVLRKVDADRYTYSVEVWKQYQERQRKGDHSPVYQALATFPPAVPPDTFPLGFDYMDGPVALDVAARPVVGAFIAGQWAQLDDLVDALSSPNQLTEDGLPRLVAVYQGLYGSFNEWKDWDVEVARMEKWHHDRANDDTADLVEAILWRAWAWHVRGSGSSSTVKPEAWELFQTKINHAAEALARCKKPACQSPLWYQLGLGIARDSDWDNDRYRDLFHEATRKFPWYVPLYLMATTYLSPQWHGSYEAVDAFARETVGTALGADYSLYTRAYLRLSEEEGLEFEPFRDSPADWALMKKGFEGLMRRYPNSHWNLNTFASFACRAHDRETYGKLRTQIGRNVTADAWASNGTADVCDAQMLEHS